MGFMDYTYDCRRYCPRTLKCVLLILTKSNQFRLHGLVIFMDEIVILVKPKWDNERMKK